MPGSTDAPVVSSLGVGVHAGGTSGRVHTDQAVLSTSSTIPNSNRRNSEVCLLGTGAGAIIVGSGETDTGGAVCC